MAGSTPGRALFYDTLTAAINDLMLHGYDSQERVEQWIGRIRDAARLTLVPEAVLERQLQDMLGQVYRRTVESDKLITLHPGVPAYRLEQIKPKLRAELDRRILASAGLIRLNRASSIERTLQRFAGWATSIPVGGTEVTDRRKTKEQIRRGIAALPFEERRVIIDQGHKLVASINDIVATDGGAIAAVWHSHWREAGYNYRQDHKARDGRIYVVRGNWALRGGLMRLDGHEYLDDITRPGEEPFCRCYVEYLYTLRDLPERMLTRKGFAALQGARSAA